MKNYVKSLYLVKMHYQEILARKESYFYFKIIECAFSVIIENLIKEKDKSLEFSNRQSDVMDAELYKKFGILVVGDFLIEDVKEKVIEVLLAQQDILYEMIKGFKSLEDY